MSEWHPQVVRLGKIGKHPEADRLELTQLLGKYTVVVQAGIWSEGDLAAWIPVDTLVPRRPEFEFLFGDKSPEVTHARVDAKKLRGITSLGMIVSVPPMCEVRESNGELVRRPCPPDLADWLPGDSVVEAFDLQKYERPMPVQMGGTVLRDPGFMPKYDLEGLRKFNEHVGMLEEREPVIVTEKIHGTNARFCYRRGELHVGSRTQALQKGTSVWWRMVEKYDLEWKLKHHPDFVFYGEVFGGSVQDLKYGLTEPALAFFDIYEIEQEKFLDYADAKAIFQGLNLPRVPQLWTGPYSFNKMLALAEGKSTLGDHVREGIVVRPLVERSHWRHGRCVLKLPGEGYLTRKQAA